MLAEDAGALLDLYLRSLFIDERLGRGKGRHELSRRVFHVVLGRLPRAKGAVR